MLPKFSNEPYLDFSKPENQEPMKKALADLKAKSSTVYDLVIGGKHVKAREQFARRVIHLALAAGSHASIADHLRADHHPGVGSNRLHNIQPNRPNQPEQVT